MNARSLLASKPERGKMTRIFEKQTFECFYDRDSGQVFENLEFRHCRFESCGISITLDPKLRSIVRNVKLINCEQQGCAVHSAIVENVLVDGFKTHGFQTFGAVFKHVTLRGKIGRIMLTPYVMPSIATPEQQRTFEQNNVDYYATVDWALDISEAQAEEIDIRRVPARLIRRDSETQMVIKREKVMQGGWRKEFADTYWGHWIELFLKEGDQDAVMVAPKCHRKYRQLLDGLKALRDAGVAEPD
jgi:hypothetical protein